MATNEKPPIESFFTKQPTSRPPLTSFFKSSQQKIQKPVKQPEKNLGERLGADFSERGKKMADIISNPNEGNFLSRGIKSFGQAAGAVGDVFSESFKSLFGSPNKPQSVEDKKKLALSPGSNLPGPVEALSNTELFKGAAGNVVQGPGGKVDYVPTDTKKLENTLETAGALGETAQIPLIGEVAKGVETPKIGYDIKNLFSKSTTKASEEELGKIQDIISPKPTVKEARLAETQGRLVKGKKPTLFKSGTSDEILPSKKVIKASETIQRNIPGAAKMDEPTLYKALDDKVTQIAKNLKPEMQKVPISEETVTKVNSDWNELKAKQLKDADTTEEKEIIQSYQRKFEDRLQNINNPKMSDLFEKAKNGEITQEEFETQVKERVQKQESANMDNLWQARKDYDASIPDNVKQANSLSSESLQNKKKIWLQNREILNSAINDTKSGLGKTSEQAFSDMTDLYEGKNGILSKAKVDTKIQPSKIRKVFNSRTGKIIRNIGNAAAIGVGVEEAVKGTKKILGE